MGETTMKTHFTVALSMFAGIAIGAVAIQGLHAQAQPKAYVVTETEVLDAAALAAYSPLIRAATDAAGGRRVGPPGGKIVAFVGEPPKRVGIQEWDSVEKAQAFRNSEAYKKLAPQREKAVKAIRSYAVEAK
jgi:uncharacterized protein (DUF1330 family)